ncbi:hypothetical protein [Streptomyces sp. NPDC058374]|uniref:hypothetical protein n=1 Tax=unclassified Streptomyces TaxID=2593676 RepID=UPI00364BA4F4
MPPFPEEPQIHESAQGPRTTPASSRVAPTPRPVPGPRSAVPPRPGPPRPAPPAQRAAGAKPGPAPAPKPPTGPSGTAGAPQIQLIPAPADGALDAADEAVDLLLDSGRAPAEVLVLTTGDPHPWTAHERSFGEDAYWRQQDAADDVFYADGACADQAEPRPVVVVAANGGADAVKTVLPAALGRAQALLIVCGDPQQINSVLGAGV